ncbi:MAG: 1-acyl-sn-glycerol-3-phosphate acyltransferase [Nitrospinae bacterium]|nr:1-acyl-sn-glycerol-3-phosphate acyltransferase [Nitrospinota bacterium]
MMLTILCRLIVRIFFREIVVEGREHLPATGPAIITPNHPNALLDPLVLQVLSPPLRLRFVAKAPLFRIPLLGWIMRRMRAIPVVRRLDTDAPVDYTPFFTACLDTLGAGDSLVIFPEGRSLPQPFMAPLRTGAARLFYLAHERGVDVRILPVGLNYERGAMFRTSVLVSVAPPLDTAGYLTKHEADPDGGVRTLIAEIGRALDQHVFQAETFRDRELLLLLERLYSEDASNAAWPQRFARLKAFERALARLRKSCPHEIDRLRHLLGRYERRSVTFGVREDPWRQRRVRSATLVLVGLSGLGVASIGWLLNWLPYKLCALLVRLTGRHESEAATYKIVYSLFLFPLTYMVQGIVAARWFGWGAAIAFGAVIVPLSYFTLRFFEWYEERGGWPRMLAAWFGRTRSRRAPRHLARLRERIVANVDALAARPELRVGASESPTSSQNDDR